MQPPSEQSYLTWFYNQYAKYLYSKARACCSNLQDVDDLVQTVWEKLITKESTLRGLDQPQQLNYISVTVRNTVREEARKKKLEICSLETVQWYAADCIVEIDEVIDRDLMRGLFHEAWQQVDPDVRELLERKYFLEENDDEIGKAMGIKSSSVRMYLTRAKRAARHTLEKHKDRLIR